MLLIESVKALLYTRVIDAKEFVLCSGHVDKVWLALGALPVQKLIHRLVLRHLLQVSADDLIERFPQVWRAALGGGVALSRMLARLVYSRINAGKANNGTAARETAYIADLSHKLGGGGFANAVHGQHGIILRKLTGQPGHLGTQSSQGHLAGQKLLCCCGNEQPGIVVLWQRREMTTAPGIDIQCFFYAEKIALPPAPFPVTLCKSTLAHAADAVAVPEGHGKIHPFLVAVGTLRTGEQLVDTGECLVGQGDEIVLQRHYCLHVKVILA